MTLTKKKTAAFILFGLSGGVFMFLLYKSWNMGISHDEASTYISFKNASFWDCLTNPDCWPNANNHLLNTLFLQQSVHLFGIQEWTLRLPNVLSYLLYSFSAIWLLWQMELGFWTMLAGFALLNFNPYFLDFFAVARGYGLSMAFLMLSLAFAYAYLKASSVWGVVGAFSAMIFSVLSNFTAFNYLAAFWAVFFLITLFKEGRSWKRILMLQGIPLGAVLILGILLHQPILWLSEKGEFNWGADRLLVTFDTLIADSLYAQNYFSSDTKMVFSILAVALISGTFMAGIWTFANRARQNRNLEFLFFAGLLVFSILIMIFQNRLLGTQYLVNRKALVFIPFSGLLLICLLQFLEERWVNWGRGLAIALLFFTSYHLLRSAVITHTREWWYDRYTRQMLDDLTAMVPEKGEVHLGVHWMFHPATEFYRITRPIEFFDYPAYDKNINPTERFDYYYVFKSDFEEKLKSEYEVAREYGGFATLLKRKQAKDKLKN